MLLQFWARNKLTQLIKSKLLRKPGSSKVDGPWMVVAGDGVGWLSPPPQHRCPCAQGCCVCETRPCSSGLGMCVCYAKHRAENSQAVSFLISQSWRSPARPPARDWISQWWQSHTIDHDLAMKTKQLCTHTV